MSMMKEFLRVPLRHVRQAADGPLDAETVKAKMEEGGFDDVTLAKTFT